MYTYIWCTSIKTQSFSLLGNTYYNLRTQIKELTDMLASSVTTVTDVYCFFFQKIVKAEQPVSVTLPFLCISEVKLVPKPHHLMSALSYRAVVIHTVN